MAQLEETLPEASSARQYALLDASFILALNQETDGVRIGLMGILAHSDIGSLLSPTVLRHLNQARIVASDSGIRDLAHRALCSLGDWPIIYWGLSDMQTEKREELATRFKHTIAPNADRETRRILAEAVVSRCDYLVTDRPSLLNIDQYDLDSLAADEGFHRVRIQPGTAPFDI